MSDGIDREGGLDGVWEGVEGKGGRVVRARGTDKRRLTGPWKTKATIAPVRRILAGTAGISVAPLHAMGNTLEGVKTPSQAAQVSGPVGLSGTSKGEGGGQFVKPSGWETAVEVEGDKRDDDAEGLRKEAARRKVRVRADGRSDAFLEGEGTMTVRTHEAEVCRGKGVEEALCQDRPWKGVSTRAQREDVHSSRYLPAKKRTGETFRRRVGVCV